MGFWTFVLIAIALSSVATIVTTFIRARHGYPLPDDDQPSGRLRREMTALSAENRDLRARLGGLEDRMQVMERIATDPAARLAKEIEGL